MLWFTHTYSDDREDELLIGVYESSEAAEAAQSRVSGKQGFIDHPEGFEIGEYTLNQDHWQDGYIVD